MATLWDKMMMIWLIMYMNILPSISIENPECLSSPLELVFLEQEYIDTKTGTKYMGYSSSLRFTARKFISTEEDYPTSFTSRVYNNIIPGPTIRFKRNKIYHLTLHNDLEAEHPNDQGILNEFHYPNTTNLHTHGLHISPESPSDDAFVSIEPGQSFEYIYYIPCNHNAGTNYYHPHHHGATALQLGGGAAGFVIIDDDTDTFNEGLPEWLLSLNKDNNAEILLMIQYMDFRNLYSWTNLNYDRLTYIESTSNSFYLLNGKYKPSLCLTINKWYRLRIAYSDVTYGQEIIFAPPDVCSIYLLAKDGVYLEKLPRLLSTNIIYFTQASRVDIAIKCQKFGEYEINTVLNNRQNIGTINVITDSSIPPVLDITEVTTRRPSYLQSLVEVESNEIYNTFHVEFRSMMNRYMINGELFSGPTDYQMEINVNEINEWTVSNRGMMNDLHPLHVHVNHFQIQSGTPLSQMGRDINMSLIGDWIDTVNTDYARIRFKSDTFGTNIVLHCHILDHEDLGMMAVYKINHGCDALDFQCIQDNTDQDCSSSVLLSYRTHDEQEQGSKDNKADISLYILYIGIGVFVLFLCPILVIFAKRKCKGNKSKDKLNDYGSIQMTETDSFKF